LQAIKDALKISSPSGVMANLFYQVPAGAAQGIQQGAGLMEAAMNAAINGMANPAIDASVNASGIGIPFAPSAAGGLRPAQIIINVNGAGDPDAVARAVVRKLQLQGVYA
jgi:hypothetical protein